MKLPLPKSRRLATLIGGGILSIILGCVGNYPPDVEGTVWVSSGPPRPIYEERTIAPGPDYFWIEGFYRWGGARYEWVPGHWEQRPSPKAKWHKGKWHHEDRGWRWVDGHWDGGDDGRGHGQGRRPEREH